MPHPRLLGVFELPAFADRKEVHARGRKSGCVRQGVREAAAAFDDLVAQVATAHSVVLADAFANRGEHFQGQAQASFEGGSVAVGALIQRRQERRHGVRVGVVQFNTVEARFLRAPRGVREERG